jgi:ferredoxin-NADP reductase
VIDETADTKTFVLATPRRWPGHLAGQYVPVSVELAGVRVRRCYSISSGGSPAGAGRIAITVKRVPGGRLSPWLHAHLQVGDLLTLGNPAGEFVLPANASPLLFVAAGSGITPVIAMLRDSLSRRPDVVVIHAARTDREAIFGEALAELAALHPSLRLIAPRDDDATTGGRLDAARLHALVPDLATRATYVCGPPGLLDLVIRAAPTARHERFVAPPRTATVDATVVTLGHRTVVAAGPGSLLDQLERAGERPPHGCRIGICQTCRCTKLTGTVEDLATGATSSEPDQEIRLCMSIARSALELAL